jgi:hypothetical protein
MVVVSQRNKLANESWQQGWVRVRTYRHFEFSAVQILETRDPRPDIIPTWDYLHMG